MVHRRGYTSRSRSRDPETNREKIERLVGKMYQTIGSNGFSPNAAKTQISAPGARKVVLGLLVDRETPRLTREFKANLRKHLYYLQHERFGPEEHANRCGGATVFGIRRHVNGLIQHARQIEPNYGDARLREFDRIKW